MSSSVATAKWLKYFAQAGIPSNAAANYAVIFTENRIQPDMLLDLNKEYLYDMGIKVMGDVIAILRYARTAYTEEAHKKILGEHSNKPQGPFIQAPTSPLELLVSTHANPPASTGKSTMRFLPICPPRSRISNSSKNEAEDRNLVSLKRKTRDRDIKSIDIVPPVIKTQKLNPKISSSDKIAPKNIPIASKGGSVFRRLGESSVSSSTDSVPTQGSSIFARLGPSKTQPVSQAASSTVNEMSLRLTSPAKHISYKGILKTVSVKREIKNTNSLTTGAELRGKPQKPIPSRLKIKETIKNRLGSKLASSTIVSTTSKTSSNSQGNLLQRSLAAIEKQRKVVKLSQTSKVARPEVKSSLSGFNSSLHNQPKVVRTLAGRNFISTSERVVKKPSIFSRLGPV